MKENCNIPKHWEIKHLEEITSVLGDGLHGTPKYSETGEYYFINGNNLTDGKIEIKANTKRVTFEEFEKFKKPLNERTIFVSINGTLGYTAFYRDEKVILGKSACYFNVLNTIDKNYIRYYLTTSSFTNYANKNATGSTIKNVGLKTMRELPIPIPPTIEEQLAIVSKIEELFSELDNGIALLKTAQQQLKVYRQSLLKWAFEGKLSEKWRRGQTSLQTSSQLLKKIKGEREDILNSNKIKIKPIQSISEEEIAELPKLPNGAVWVKLGEILWSVKDGPHYSPKYQEHGIPFISGGNIRPNGIDFKNVKYISKELHDELSRRCKPMKMDVLYTKGGTTGIAKVNDYDIDFNVWVHVAVLKAISLINPYYLQYVLNSNHCYKQAQKYTHGVGNQDLGLTRMILITLPVFSIEEQNYIVSELESKLTVCDKIEETISQSLQQAETLRQSILKKAFEGKLVKTKP